MKKILKRLHTLTSKHKCKVTIGKTDVDDKSEDYRKLPPSYAE